MKRSSSVKQTFAKSSLMALIIFFVSGGLFAVWAVTLPIPDVETYFRNIEISQSTKIFDRTGEVLLYDVHGNVKRTVVPFDQISDYAKKATVAVEDKEFYNHKGIRPTSIARALMIDIITGSIQQGGSTITQQVIKNILLINEKRLSRKIKELILAPKLEASLTKDQILNLYLNAIPYGGSIYGIEEASQNFFNKSAKDLTLAESAYIAALPQAPSFYSPYGRNKNRLEERKNLVLSLMREQGMITEAQMNQAKAEKVAFAEPDNRGIKAPHFVFYVKQYLEEKYGEDAVENGGLKVITTLDWELQQKAEDIVKKYGDQNIKNFNAKNASMVAVDPKTGHILVMVGSRDYFDMENDGNYNVALALRQPGSTFKPFVYATALNKGYTSETAIFDVPTEFDTGCTPDSVPVTPGATCYHPVNYDDKFMGPMTFRTALAQSRNIPAIKTLYLAGIADSINTAQAMGISTLTDPKRYGLTLVLGGGEVSLLDLTSAYGVFAHDGVRASHEKILRVEDRDGKVLEEFKEEKEEVLPANTARTISNILSDNNARTPAFGANSPLYFGGRDVAAKTGTTNDYRDVWIVGYTPNIAVGAWAGNNDNTPMEKKVAGLVIAPMWHAFMEEALAKLPEERFVPPEPINPSIKPYLRGIWQGNETYVVDRISGKLATDNTPPELREEKAVTAVHSILYWVNKSDPLGPVPSNPAADPQFRLWEEPVRRWAAANGYGDQSGSVVPNEHDDIHTDDRRGSLEITSPNAGKIYDKDDRINVSINYRGRNDISHAEFYLNNTLIGSSRIPPYQLTFTPDNVNGLQQVNNLRVVVYDEVRNKTEQNLTLNINTLN